MNATNIKASHLFVTIFAVWLISLLKINYLWGHGNDIADHYDLIFKITEKLTFGFKESAELGAMVAYPKFAHNVAALAGILIGSPFLGMQVMILASLAIIWVGLGYLASCVRGLPQLFSLFFFLLGLLSCLYAPGFGWHGHEVITNYFYPQLVGQAIVVLAIACAALMESQGSRKRYIYTLLIVAIWLTLNTHLTPAVELMGVLAIFTLVNAIDWFRGRKFVNLRIAGIFLMLVIGASLGGLWLIVNSQRFAVMRQIAQHNGYLEFWFIGELWHVLPLAAFGLAISIVVLLAAAYSHHFRIFPQARSIRWLAFYGLASSGLMVVQYVLLNFGMGSPYAVKKFVFSVSSVIFVELSVVLGLLSHILWVRLKFSDGLTVAFSRSVWAFCLVTVGVAGVMAVTPWSTKASVSEIVGYESRLWGIRNNFTPLGAKVFVGDLNGIPGYVSRMYTIGIFNQPRHEVPIGFSLDVAPKFDFIISDSRIKHAFDDCRQPYPVGAVGIYRSDCVRKNTEDIGKCVGRYDLSSQGTILDWQVTGFSGPESVGRWTDGAQASFQCTVKESGPKMVVVSLKPFLHSSLRNRKLVLETETETVVFQVDGSNEVFKFPISRHVAPGQNFKLRIGIPEAGVTPKDLGMSADSRKLGFLISEIRFEGR